MDSEGGRQEFSIGLDLDQLRQDAEQGKRLLHSISEQAVTEGGIIDKAMGSAGAARGFSVLEAAIRSAGRELKGMDFGTAQQKIASLSAIIGENETVLAGYTARLEEARKAAQEAFASGDDAALEKLTKEIDTLTQRTGELTTETQGYREQLDAVMSASGLGGGGKTLPKLYDSEEDLKHVEELKQRIQDLAAEISRVQASGGDTKGLTESLTKTKDELRGCEEEAAKAAAALGSDLGGRAVMTQQSLRSLSVAIGEQSQKILSLTSATEQARQAYDRMKSSGKATSEQVEAAAANYNELAGRLSTARAQMVVLQNAQADEKAHWNDLTAEIREHRSAMDGLTGSYKKGTSSMNALSGAMSSLKTAAAGAFSIYAVANFTKQIVSVRGEFEKLEVSFRTMLGDSGKAGDLMDRLTDLAAKTPFDLQGVANGAKQLLAYGSTAEQVIDELKMLGNIASALNISLSDMVYLYGTTRTQGRLYMQDFNQFMNRGIPLADELAKQFGVAKDEVRGLVTEGRIGFPEVEKAMKAMTSEGGKFYNLMEEQSKTNAGHISNISDAFQRMLNDIGKDTGGVINKALDITGALIENYKKLAEAIGVLIGIYGTYKAAVIVTTAVENASRAARMLSIASTNSYTAATLLLVRAKQRLAAVTARVKTAMLANPYALAAAAVAALGYGIYKLATYQGEAEKAQKKLNEAMQSAEGSISAETNRIDIMFDRLKAAKKGTDEYKAAKQAIIDQYGDYLKGMGDEVESLNDVATAYNLITENAVKAAKARNFAKVTEDVGNVIADAQGRAMDRVSEIMDKRFGKDKWSGYASILNAYINGTSREVTPELQDLLGQFDVLTNVGGSNVSAGTQIVSNDLKMVLNRLDEVRGMAEQTMDEAAKKWGYEAQDAVDSADKEAESLRYVSDIEKEILSTEQKIAELRSRKGATSEDEKALKNELSTLDSLRSEYKMRTGREYGSRSSSSAGSGTAQKEAQDAEKALDDYYKAREGAEKEASDLEYEMQKRNSAGRLEQIETERRHALEALDDEERRYVELAEKAGIDNPDMSPLILKRIYTNSEYDAQAKEVYDSYLEEFGSYEDKRKAIAEKYAGIIASLEAKGYSEAARNAEAARDKELDGLKDSITSKYKDLFGDVSRMTQKQIKGNILRIRQMLKSGKDDSGNAFGVDDIKALEEQLDEYYNSLEQWQSIDMSASWMDVAKQMTILIRRQKQYNAESDKSSDNAKSLKDSIEKSKEVIGSMAAGAGINSFVSALSKAAESMKKIAEASGDVDLGDAAEELSAVAQNLDAAGQGYASTGSWIGAVVGGATDILGRTLDAITGIKVAAAQYKQFLTDFQNKIELLKYTISDDDYDTIFGTNALMKAVGAFKIFNEAYTSYSNVVTKKMEDTPKNRLRIAQGRLQEGMTELQSMMINVTHRSGWAKFWGASDKYKSLFSIAPEIWGGDINGEFNVENAKAFLDTNKDITQAQRSQIQNAIDLAEAYQDAYEQVEEVAGKFVSTISDSITDIAWDKMVSDSELAFNDVKKIGTSVITSLGKQMISSRIIDQFASSYQEALTQAFGTGDYESAISIIDQMMEAAPDVVNGYADVMQHYIDKARELGYDVSSSSSREASTKGLEAVTQDSIDELNGRATAIQGHTNLISGKMEMLLDNSNAILRSVMNIDSSTDSMNGRMASMEKDIKEVRSAVGDLATKGIRIRS